jgi:hypothetical protein
MSELSTKRILVPDAFGRPHPLESFVDAMDELSRFENVHTSSLNYVAELGPAVTHMLTQRGFPDEKLQTIRNLATAADAALRSEQHYLSELVVIRLWAIIEVAVDGTAMLRLMQNDWWRTAEVARRVKGSLVDFAGLNTEQQLRVILDEIAQGAASRVRRGIDGFEELLGRLGLKGDLDAEPRRLLIQLAATRNVIVHKNGIVDNRFVAHCPWLRLTVGTRIIVTPHDVETFRTAAFFYVYELGRRMQNAGLFDPGEQDAGLFTDALSEFRAHLAKAVENKTGKDNLTEP